MSDIHESAIVGPLVELGHGVPIGPYAVVSGSTRIDDDVWIGPHVATGTPGEIRGSDLNRATTDSTGITIGPRSVTREFVTVHLDTSQPTTVGNDCYVMARSHIPHDATLGDHCTISTSVQIGGHSIIGDGAALGLGSLLHQWSVNGAGAMIGLQATVTRPVPPFATVVGVQARIIGANAIAIGRLGFDADAGEWHRALRSEPSDLTDPPEWMGPAVKKFKLDCLRNHR